MNTVHIIASCTDRKRLPPLVTLRSVPHASPAVRARAWWRQLRNQSGRTTPAAELYSGDHWAVVRTLPEAARTAGLRPVLWVASAGYGLIPASAPLCAYSATFARRSPDAVAHSAATPAERWRFAEAWWSTISGLAGPDRDRPRSVSQIAEENPHGRILVVASGDYVNAMESDLLRATRILSSSDHLVIVTARDRLATEELFPWGVPSDARLQSSVGGARTSLHARVARKILGEARRWDLSAADLRARYEGLVGRAPALVPFDRRRLTDAEVSTFVRRALHSRRHVSCTALLRELREGGRACEQGRFKQLFHALRGTTHAS